jgi:hypothetical protein
VKTLSESSEVEIENEHLSVKFQGVTGLIETVLNKDTDTEVTLHQEVFFLLFSFIEFLHKFFTP